MEKQIRPERALFFQDKLSAIGTGRKRVLVVLFVPSVERDGAKRYTTPEAIQDTANLAELGSFCRRLGREANQGEVGLVVGDEYFAVRQFEEV